MVGTEVFEADNHLEVKLVVKVLVNLLRVAVLAQQSAQHAHAADPEDLGGQTRLACSLPLTCSGGQGLEVVSMRHIVHDTVCAQ